MKLFWKIIVSDFIFDQLMSYNENFCNVRLKKKTIIIQFEIITHKNIGEDRSRLDGMSFEFPDSSPTLGDSKSQMVYSKTLPFLKEMSGPPNLSP